MDYDSTLQYLQQLLSGAASTKASEYQSGLGLLQQQLAQQGTEYTAGLQSQQQMQAAALANTLQLAASQGATQEQLATITAQGNLATTQATVSGQEQMNTADLALQKVIADYQNQQAQGQLNLAQTGQQQQFGLQANQQNFNQNQAQTYNPITMAQLQSLLEQSPTATQTLAQQQASQQAKQNASANAYSAGVSGNPNNYSGVTNPLRTSSGGDSSSGLGATSPYSMANNSALPNNTSYNYF